MISSIWCYHSTILLLLLAGSLATGLYTPPPRRCCWVANVTLFSHLTLIRKPQSTSNFDHFHARGLQCSCVKSRNDLISSRRGDSGVLFSFIHIDARSNVNWYFITVTETTLQLCDWSVLVLKLTPNVGQFLSSDGSERMKSIGSPHVGLGLEVSE